MDDLNEILERLQSPPSTEDTLRQVCAQHVQSLEESLVKLRETVGNEATAQLAQAIQGLIQTLRDIP